MKRIRIVGLCLVAVFAFGAIVASAAQAAGPEWGRCAPQKKGKYTEGNCLTEAAQNKHGVYKGKYEWVSLVEEEAKHGGPWCGAQKKGNYTDPACTIVSEKKGVPNHKGHFEKYGPNFTGKGGVGILNAIAETCYLEPGDVFTPETKAECDHLSPTSKNVQSPLYVECTSERSSGNAKGVKDVEKIAVTFTGCELNGSIPCANTANPGEIVTKTLKGELGYLEKSAAPPKVGILLEPEAGGAFAEFACAEGVINITVGAGNAIEGMYYEGTGNDGIMAPVTPINASSTGFEQVFADGGKRRKTNRTTSKAKARSTCSNLRRSRKLGAKPSASSGLLPASRSSTASPQKERSRSKRR